MHFEEGRHLNQPQYEKSEARTRINSTGQPPRESARRGTENHRAPRNRISTSKSEEASGILDDANHKLQELMQLFYLLGRDPAVPTDARYHVTVAQSEIAWLTRLMQNAAADQAEKGNPPAGGNATTASP
jgi:hypothetical protein